ncbi:MAG: ATP-binding protein [Bacteroidales bacterium]|jgi:hypothetical protein
MIKRILQQVIENKINKGKAIILLGPRQTGKTTLLKIIAEKHKPYLFLDGDDPTVRNILNTPNTGQLRNLIGNHKMVFIDEAQRINNIGITLKIITDQLKGIQLLVSGSSALEINHTMNEPLTGRKWEYLLYPISWQELENNIGYLSAIQILEQRLLFGMYPDVINNNGEEKEILKHLLSSYLYKDVLEYGGIKKPEIIDNLLQALAFQVGNEVSYNELSQLLNIDRKTVGTYIDLLEKAFIVFKLHSFSRNLRNEIKTNKKVYFYDNGVRNMLIGNFQPISQRFDKGAIWENFLISERKKHIEYSQSYAKMYFWRTAQQQEIDYIEEKDGIIKGYEFKWEAIRKVKIPKLFIQSYNADVFVIDKNNFIKFIGFKDTSNKMKI